MCVWGGHFIRLLNVRDSKYSACCLLLLGAIILSISPNLQNGVCSLWSLVGWPVKQYDWGGGGRDGLSFNELMV